MRTARMENRLATLNVAFLPGLLVLGCVLTCAGAVTTDVTTAGFAAALSIPGIVIASLALIGLRVKNRI